MNKKFSAYFDKRFLFSSTAHVFHIAQKSQNYNHRFHCDHLRSSERENVSEELFDYLFWMLYVYFCSCRTWIEISFLLSWRRELHHRFCILTDITLFSWHAFVVKVVVVLTESQTKQFFPQMVHIFHSPKVWIVWL